MIPELNKRYGVPVGYSGHETGIATSVAAVALGACVIERHITMEPCHVGLRPGGLVWGPTASPAMVRDIRLVEMQHGDGVKRVFGREKPIIRKLRRVGANP